MINTEFWKNKRVFITGHTGFKGSWLALWLSEMGADVTGYALTPPTQPSLFECLSLEEAINHKIGDIRDLDALKEAISSSDPEIVLHLAAQPLVRESYIDPVGTYSTNVMGTVNLLEAVRNCKSVRAVVNVTTDKCYENKEWCWPYREDDRLGGYDPYSNSKGCSELVTSSYRDSFFNPEKYGVEHRVAIASARAGNVLGGGDWAKDRLIPDILRSFNNGEAVNIRSPHSIRPWQHVLEPLSGYLLLAQKLFSENGLEYAQGWNFGPYDSGIKSVGWIVDYLCNVWGDNASYEIETGDKPHEANLLKLDISKAQSKLNWTPTWSLTETLDLIVEWNKAYHNGDYIKKICIEQINKFCSKRDC